MDNTSDIFYGTRFAWLTGSGTKQEEQVYHKHVGSDTGSVVSGVTSVASTTRGGPKASTQAARPSKQGLYFKKAIWLIGGLLTLLVPVFIRNARLNNYQNQAWAGAAAQQVQGGAYFLDMNNCKWYKWGCTPYYVDERGQYVSEWEMKQRMYEEQQRAYEEGYNYQGQQAQQQQQYNYQGGNQQMQANYYGGGYNQYGGGYNQNGGGYNQNGAAYNQYSKSTSSSAGLKFFYSMQVIAFLAIMAYGYHSLNKPSMRIVQILMAWFFLSCLAMILLKTLYITGVKTKYNLRGYYGQFSVLMFLANIGFAIFSLPASLFFLHHLAYHKPASASDATKTLNDDEYVNV